MSRRRETVLYGLMLSMDLLAGFALLVAIGAARATPAGFGLFWYLLLAGLAAAAAAMVVDGGPWPDGVGRAILLAAGAALCGALAAIVGGGAASMTATAALAAVMVWRGVVVTRDEPHHDEVQRRFAYGFGLLFLGIVWIIVWGTMVSNGDWQILAMVGIAYSVVGMAALSLARLEAQREPEVSASVFLTVALQLGALFLAALIALQIFAIDIVQSLARLLRPALSPVAGFLGAAVQLILGPLFRLAALIHANVKPFRPRTGVTAFHRNTHHPAAHAAPGSVPAAVQLAEIAALVLVTAGAVYLLWRIMPHRRRRVGAPGPGSGQERSKLVTPGEWLRLTAAWILGLLRRPTRSAVASVQRIKQRVFGPPYPDDPIRRTYSQMLRRAEAAGLHREGAVTPSEFQQRLQVRWPAGFDDFEALTSAYMVRRYGEVEAAGGAVESVRACGERLRAVMRD